MLVSILKTHVYLPFGFVKLALGLFPVVKYKNIITCLCDDCVVYDLQSIKTLFKYHKQSL